MTKTIPKSILSHALAAIVLWILFALIFSSAGHLQLLRLDNPRPYFSLLQSNFIGFGSSAIIAPLVFAMGRQQAKLAFLLLKQLKYILIAVTFVYLWHALYSTLIIAPFQGQTAQMIPE